MSKTSFNSTRNFSAQQPTVGAAVEKVRRLSSTDSEIRVRVDTTAHTVIAFSATWVNRSTMQNPRRAFLETKVENGVHRVIFSEKLFDEGYKINEYVGDDMDIIAGDIMRFLRDSKYVERTLKLAA